MTIKNNAGIKTTRDLLTGTLSTITPILSIYEYDKFTKGKIDFTTINTDSLEVVLVACTFFLISIFIASIYQENKSLLDKETK